MKNIRISFFCFFILFFYACNNEPYPQGKNLYTFYCASCHMDDGTGLVKLIPPLNHQGHIESISGTLPCIIKYGIEGPITVDGAIYNQKMEGFKQLTDAEISNIINYMLFKWGENQSVMLPQQVATKLQNCTVDN